MEASGGLASRSTRRLDKDMEEDLGPAKARKRARLVVIKLPFTVRDDPLGDEKIEHEPASNNRIQSDRWCESSKIKVLTMLGGSAAVARFVFMDKGKKTSGLPLFFQPDVRGSTSHTESSVIDRTPIVVRVQRDFAGGPIRSAQIVGAAEHYLGYNKLADFVFRSDGVNAPLTITGRSFALPDEPGLSNGYLFKLPAAMAPIFMPRVDGHAGGKACGKGNTTTSSSAEDEWKRIMTYLPPARFAMSKLSKPFRFAAGPPAHALDKVSASSKKDDFAGTAMTRTALTSRTQSVPRHSMMDLANLTQASDQKLVIELRRAFDLRPCWTKAALREWLAAALPSSDLHEKSKNRGLELVNHVAYLISEGPFKYLLVRYSYDPRLDRSASQWQPIILSLSGTEQEAIENNPGCRLLCGVALQLPVKQHILQLCDLRHNAAKQLAMSNVQFEFSRRHGWFVGETLMQVTQMLLNTIRQGIEKVKESGGDMERLSPAVVFGDLLQDSVGKWDMNMTLSTMTSIAVPSSSSVPLTEKKAKQHTELSGYDILGDGVDGEEENDDDNDSIVEKQNDDDDDDMDDEAY